MSSWYWYLGPLKSKFAYVFATVQEWPPVFKAHLAYRPPVDVPEEPEVNQQQYSFFSRLFSWIWRTEQKEPEIEEVEEIPWKEVDVSTLEFSAETHNDNVENALKTTGSMSIETLPTDITKTGFIKEGWRRVSKAKDNKSEIQSETLQVGEFKLTPVEPEASFFSIDNEQFDAYPVHVKILPNKLRFFINEETNQT
ncbi:acylglycerol kinase, mitochondrial-like, partial [Anneissia japonica]|uniref:acylglycerol kinase, mitochondrial-like n=1 Tax=Anneissia japonica TaxID=1529436 RepID=UPI0014258E65